MSRATITGDPIDLGSVVSSVSSTGHGATVLFLGTVRDVNDGRAVTGLEYGAYEAMARDELAAIVEEAEQRFQASQVAAVHRLGSLGLGETSVAVAAAHAHREAAFDACRYVIEELKRRVPIWKRERYADGGLAWVSVAAGDVGEGGCA